jgi:benzoylformate decarboxylase
MMATAEMTGADAICRILKDRGVRYVFGVPGNTEVPLLDALASDPDLEYISAVHESASIAMADGYARASGKVGVVLVHTAPGTANIVGGLYNAFNAGSPVVVLAGMQDSRLPWSDAFLDSDLLPMVSQHTKSREWVARAEDLAGALDRALREAAAPPAGPVFLAVPRDLQAQAEVAGGLPVRSLEEPVCDRADAKALSRAAQLLADAERPAIMAGHALPDADAIDELAELAELIGAPVYTTAQVPRLIFPSSHPLYFSRVPPIGFSLPGLDGPADVLLAVGSRLCKQLFHVEGPLIPSATTLIQIDHNPQGLATDCQAEVSLAASPRGALADLTAEVSRIMSPAQRQRSRDRLERLKDLREQVRAAREADFSREWDEQPIRPSRAIREIAAALPQASVVVDEAVMLTSYVESIMEFSEPGSYFSSNACLGWGLPASMGVALGTSRHPVVALIGDGSALFGLQGLWTAARYRIPAVLVVLNNRGYAAIKWAMAMYPERQCAEDADLGCNLGDVDFTLLAQAFGISARRIDDAAEIGPALRSAAETGQPMLLDIPLDPSDVGYGLPGLR